MVLISVVARLRSTLCVYQPVWYDKYNNSKDLAFSFTVINEQQFSFWNSEILFPMKLRLMETGNTKYSDSSELEVTSAKLTYNFSFSGWEW